MNQWINRRPNRLLPRPIKLELSLSPQKIRLHQREFTPRSCTRAERISGVWHNRLEVRDYFRIETEEGTPLWIFEGAENEFFLHGYFDQVGK